MNNVQARSTDALRADLLSRQLVAHMGHLCVGTLRGIYGPYFAEGFSDMPRLSQIFRDLDERSLRQLMANKN
ncbi:MAG TPA: hypothetical protein VL574_00730 [Stellaceae bacterium]|nr:hypothetical protein [Stellaceae bacterium]